MINLRKWKERKRRRPRDIHSVNYIGRFILSPDRVIFRGMRYKQLIESMVADECNIRLDAEFEESILNGDSTLRDFLDWIQLYIYRCIGRYSSENNLRSLGAQFVCHANVLKLISGTPYKSLEDWQIFAVKFEDAIFLDKIPSSTLGAENDGKCAKSLEDALKRIMTDCPMSTTQYEVIACFVGNIRLLFTENIDCIDKAGEFVQFKVLRSDSDFQNIPNGSYSFDYWISAYLCGASSVVVGYVDENGTIKSLKRYYVHQLADFGKKYWSDRLAMTFLYSVLNFIKERFRRAKAETLLISYDPRNGRVSFHVNPDNMNYDILPETFRRFFKTLKVSMGKYKGFTESVPNWRFLYKEQGIKFGEPKIISEFNESNGINNYGRDLCPKLNNELVGKECYMNLENGIESFEMRDSVPDYLKCLLNWITDWIKEQRLPSSLDTLDADFFCRKSLLRKIGCTLLYKKIPWRFGVIKYHNVHFLCELRYRANTSLQQQKIEFYGHKFEQYMTSPTNQKHFPPVSTVSNFFVMVNRQLGDLRLLFRSEVDCFDDEGKEYVELKTIARKFYDEGGNHLRVKLGDWWLQSYLSGIKRIIYGLRDDDVVTMVGTYNVDELQNFGVDLWDCQEIVQFIHDVLRRVKIELAKVPELTELAVEYSPEEQHIRFLYASARNDHYFLPDEFVERFAL